MDILLKHPLKQLTDFIGNRHQITKLKAALQLNGGVLLLGVPGSGKTTIAELSFANYNTLVVTKENIASIHAFITDKTITSFFDKRKKAILFDDIDILICNDKTPVSFFIKIAQDVKNRIPCIFTCNLNDEKKILDLKKHVEAIKINLPIPKECFTYLMRLLDRENVQYDIEHLLQTCHAMNGNVRESIAEVMHGRNDEQVTLYKNLNVFETVRRLLSQPLTMRDTFYLIDEEPNITSCMYYENIPEEIYNNRTKDMSTALAAYSHIADTFIESTVFEDYMCKNHEWALWDLIFYMRFLGANNILMSLPRTENAKDVNVAFSQILSKVSHKNIMVKRLRNVAPSVSQETRILLADDQAAIPEKRRKLILNADENILVNTYTKYFVK
jgi:hypothetical protein